MSAIYGIIDLCGREIPSNFSAEWKEYYQKFAIDRFGEICEPNFFMGCGIQYFSKEAQNEELPFQQGKRKVYFTADCFIDNREELIGELQLPNTCPDGTIILEAFNKWGRECVLHLKGVFTFVIYDAEKNEIFLTTDQFAQRTLFYHVRDGRVYFSTLMMPILQQSGLHFEKNDRWLTDCVSIRSAMMITEPKETAICGINKLVAGTYVVISVEKGCNKECELKEIRYYNPLGTIAVDKSVTKEKSEQLIRETVRNAVKRIIRTDGKIGTQLSCGLDSSTVACTAASLLKEKGEKLYSYTSIPLKEAGLKNTGAVIFDETEGVMDIVKAYPNIVPTFLDTPNRNYLREVDDILRIWELPCKSQQNAIWLDEIYRKASQDGCKILLSGATGNTNISAGKMEDLFFYYLKRLRFQKAYRALDFATRARIPRKRILKYLCKKLADYYLWYFRKRDRDCYEYILTRKDIGEQYRLTKRFHKQIYHFKPYKSFKRIREEMYLTGQFAQIGEVETKDSLAYGVLTRDPFRTVEINELCFRLPLECFVSNDFERRLVRAGMNGIVPDSIRLNLVQRGRQSGDNLYRLKAVWGEFENVIRNALTEESVLAYLSKEQIEACFDRINHSWEQNELDVLLLVDAYSFSRYLSVIK